eukprot:965271-Amphidinium_carterae.1
MVMRTLVQLLVVELHSSTELPSRSGKPQNLAVAFPQLEDVPERVMHQNSSLPLYDTEAAMLSMRSQVSGPERHQGA